MFFLFAGIRNPCHPRSILFLTEELSFKISCPILLILSTDTQIEIAYLSFLCYNLELEYFTPDGVIEMLTNKLSIGFYIFFIAIETFANADKPQITTPVDTEFGVYQPYLDDATPQVARYEVAPDFSNVSNYKKFQFNEKEKQTLLRNAFVAVPTRSEQIYDIYISCAEQDIPIFVTTDALLHTYHILYDYTLRILEVQELADDVSGLSETMLNEMINFVNLAESESAQTAALNNAAYFLVANKLLETPLSESFKPEINQREALLSLVLDEIEIIEAHQGFAPSLIFGYDEDYSQYVPRGHYTRNELLKRYFKAMMWYGRMIFHLKPSPRYGGSEKGKEATLQALLIVAALHRTNVDGKPSLEIWDRVYQPTTFFVGKTDDLDVYDYTELAKQIYGEDFATLSPDDFADDAKLEEFIDAAKELPDPLINSSFVFESEDMASVTKGFRFMGQRFIPDSYMLYQLVHSRVSGRLMPKGLDVMAVLQSERAYNLLVDFYNEDQYPKYVAQMEKLREEFGGMDVSVWAQNLYWNWLYVLMPLLEEKGEGYPTFMQNTAWTDKQLAAALGSWTELRHDTILYAKQSYTEVTGMPPAPQFIKGYVEPNPEVYARLAALARFMRNGLSERDLMLPEFSHKLTQLEELLLSLEEISENELELKPISEEQYKLIVDIGETLENLTTFSDEISGLIEGTEDEKMAVVADVHTDPNSGSVLEEGVGHPMNLFVIVQIEGELYVTQGGMFSYYEFTQQMSNRLTDSQWQELLDTNPPALPKWFGSFAPVAGDPVGIISPVEPKGKKPIVWGALKNCLYQNYPNPFNPETWIPFELADEADVSISIYGLRGQLIRQIELGNLPAGKYIDRTEAAYWNGRNENGEKAASGVYFYRLLADDFTAGRKMSIVK